MYTFLSVLISRIIPQIWIFGMELVIKIYRDFDFLEDNLCHFSCFTFIRREKFFLNFETDVVEHPVYVGL